MSLRDKRDKERQVFEGGVYLQLGFSVRAYLLTEKDVHKILLNEKKTAGYKTVFKQPFENKYVHGKIYTEKKIGEI